MTEKALFFLRLSFNSDALLQEKETMQQIQMLDETMKVHR
jgi:hypothetical protein